MVAGLGPLCCQSKEGEASEKNSVSSHAEKVLFTASQGSNSKHKEQLNLLHSAPWTIKACLFGTLSMVCSSKVDTYKCILTEQG